MTRTAFDFSGIGVAFYGLAAETEARLRGEWAAFAAGSEEPLLRIAVGALDRESSGGRYHPKGMRSELRTGEARFAMDEGEARVDASGRAEIHLARGAGEREWFTLLNLFRACLAWWLPSRGGAMVHAAGIVVGGRAFVLVGGEGAGKSTWASLVGEAGERVISDDVVLLDGAGPTIELAAAPLRSTYRVAWAPGRWPLAAILFPRHGAEPSRTAVATLMAQARLTANLPFVADAVESDPRVGAVVDRLLREVDTAELTFARDARFLELLRTWS